MMNKIGLIVEGVSDKLFFDNYFKPNFLRNLKVRTSGTKGICKILNEKSIESHIKALRIQQCTKIFILIDLDTQCGTITYNCILKLKKWYESKIKISNDPDIMIVIASQELESWMHSAWENSDNKNKRDLERLFQNLARNKKSLNEKELFSKFKNSKKNIDRTKNKSLEYFLVKLGL